jgi:outer membrane protein OmpA-like peptidoglycan-associated protein
LINRKRENSCKGNLRGYVLDNESYEPVRGAQIRSGEGILVTTNAEGYFELKGLSTGFEVLTAVATGYKDGQKGADVGEGDENDEIQIYLEKGGKTVTLNNKKLSAGESVTLNNILFDVGKATLRPESYTELDKVVQIMQQNPALEIELSGHTSSEGDLRMNRSLSYQRVNACKQYITDKGIDPGRIIAVGYGPDKPVAPNDTEANRAKNRRVEMRITKL